MKDDDFSPVCTFDDLEIFHLNILLSLKLLTLHTLIFTCLIYFCLHFTKIKAFSVTVTGIQHEHHCLVWVTPAVVVLECLSLTGSISSLVTGCWPVIGQLRLTLRPDWLSPGDCLMPDRGCLEKLTAWRQRESTESTSSLGEHQGTTDGQRCQYNSLIAATN